MNEQMKCKICANFIVYLGISKKQYMKEQILKSKEQIFSEPY